MAGELKNFRLVRTAGLKGLVLEFGHGKGQDGFYSWEDMNENVAYYLHSIGSPYVEKIETADPEAIPSAKTPKKQA